MDEHMFSYFQSNRREVLRWALSSLVVLLAHVSIAATVIDWSESLEATDPVGALVVEFAPTPVAPINDPTEVQPGPDQVQADASVERRAEPTEKAVEKDIDPDPAKEQQQEIAQQENPVVALQKKTPEPKPEKPKPSEARPAAPVTSAPQMSKTNVAAVAAAPRQTRFNLVDSNAVPTWKRQVANKLERNKKYPSAAQARDEKGIAQLEFSVDRQGNLRSSRIVKSSGSDALDRETLDLVKRAQPFAAPPAAMAGNEIFLIVPIQFNIH